MANQLLATFYVKLSQAPTSVDATIQVKNEWNNFNSVSGLSCTTTSPTDGSLVYKIDVERVQPDDYYTFCQAGAYECKLTVTFGGEPLERLIYLTIQPDVEVWRGTTKLVETAITQGAGTNPANYTMAVSLTNKIQERTINLNKSPDGYAKEVFVKSNVLLDIFSNDLSTESNSNTWLLLKNRIRLTRKTASASYQWSNSYAPVIKTDGQNQHYAEFVNNSSYYSDYYMLGKTVILGLEKPLLELPLYVNSVLSLNPQNVAKFKSNGGGTTETTSLPSLPLTAILKTPHEVSITPSILTLDDDNNWTSFVTVEANEGANWTLTPDSKLTVSPTSGTGRKAVVVQKNHNMGSANFVKIQNAITATSTVNATTYPVIDGNYTATAIPPLTVHLEQYSQTKNALIPRQTAIEAIGKEMFNNTLTDWGKADGTWESEPVKQREALANLDNSPKVEFEFSSGKSHRIRSWSLQSVGEYGVKRVAKTLVLQGWTDNQWKILDMVTLSGFYNANKPRVDKVVHHREIVSKIRIVVIATEGSYGAGTDVYLPQIQVFAGAPVMPNMAGSNENDSVVIQNRSDATGWAVFDRKVGGSAIASVGTASWYANSGMVPLNDVAIDGAPQAFIVDANKNTGASQCWLTISFPPQRLIGYLYAIDDLSDKNFSHAQTPYAASIYFEGRSPAVLDQNQPNSTDGNYTKIDLISLDRCAGKTSIASANINQSNNQTNLTTWAKKVLKATTDVELDKAFMTSNDLPHHFLQYDKNLSGDKWQSKGSVFLSEMDTIDKVDNQTHYADFENIQVWAQLRFIVQSVMNLFGAPDGSHVTMPEMQFFALPAKPINQDVNKIASVSYFKAQKADGELVDILGRHQWLPFLDSNKSKVRIYWGNFQNSNDQHPHIDIHYANNIDSDLFPSYPRYWYEGYGDITIDLQGYATEIPYYELYIYSETNEKIILSSGYIGDKP